MSDNIRKNSKCERCQIEEVAVICHTCHPFHNFCNRCDSIIHSMKLKNNHIREPNLNQSNFQRNLSISSSMKVLPNSQVYQRSLTPRGQFIHSPFLDNNSKYNLNIYNSPRNEQNYSNNYINELKRLNQKEKDAMKYKIDSMQNYLERLKSNFQNELKNAENKSNQYLNEKKILEEKLNQLIEVTLKEKDNIINLVKKENEHLKEKIKILESQLREKKFQNKKKEEEYNNYIDNLKDEIKSIRNDNTNMQEAHENKVTEMVKANVDNLKNIDEKYKKEIYDIYFDGKTKNDKLIQQVQNDYSTIEMLKNNNNNLQQIIQKLEHNNHLLLHENIQLKNKNSALNNNLKSSYNVNENLKKNIEKIKIENNNMKNEFDYFENTINSLKNELLLMNEISAKKDKDFNYLLTQSEKIRKEFSCNMFNNEELDIKNRELIKENEELKRALMCYQKN